ncbi:cytochrome oxidase putative small subunit CydP [Bradyrhizobium oligotrophicum S58]
MNDRRLFRHLGVAIAAKLVLLLALWWAFVRDARIDVDAPTAAAHLVGANSARQPLGLPGALP